MATGETGFDDVGFDLISLQYHERAERSHELLRDLSGSSESGPALV
jgi:hypothetical protein